MRARRHRTRARSRRSPLASASSEQLANHMALPWMEQVRGGERQNFRLSGINAGSERPRQLKLGDYRRYPIPRVQMLLHDMRNTCPLGNRSCPTESHVLYVNRIISVMCDLMFKTTPVSFKDFLSFSHSLPSLPLPPHSLPGRSFLLRHLPGAFEM